MEGPILHSVVDSERKRRVDIFKRDRNGTFGFEESRWDSEDKCWIPIGPDSDSFTDTLEGAIVEAQGRVSWLAQYLKDSPIRR